MVGEQNDDGVLRMRPVIERIESAAELFVGPPNTGEVSVYCLLPSAVLAHPVVCGDLRIAQRHFPRSVGNVVPVIVVNAR